MPGSLNKVYDASQVTSFFPSLRFLHPSLGFLSPFRTSSLPRNSLFAPTSGAPSTFCKAFVVHLSMRNVASSCVPFFLLLLPFWFSLFLLTIEGRCGLFGAFSVSDVKTSFCVPPRFHPESPNTSVPPVRACSAKTGSLDRSMSNRKEDTSLLQNQPTSRDARARVVLVTYPSGNSLESDRAAEKLAGQLVSLKLAACVNIVPSIRSVYEWEGKIQKDDEVLMIIKTREELVEELTAFVIKEHPYDCPEVISTDITGGSAEFIRWIYEVTARRKPDGN